MNPFEGLSPFVPVGFVVDDESKETVRLEEEGFKALAHTAFVLVAGGLG